MSRLLTNVVGFDDGPFPREPRGGRRARVMVVGAVCARTRLDGVVSGYVRKDGADATALMASLVRDSQFDGHVRAVLLGGIAVGGFNVVDIHALAAALGVRCWWWPGGSRAWPLIRAALAKLPGGARRWRLIEAAGPMEPVGNVFVQRAGLALDEARYLLKATTLHGHIPEPLRLAHLIAGGVVTGKSRGRA